MPKNSNLKYIRKTERKRGRPKITTSYVFNNEKYLWLIFLINNCEQFHRQPTFTHLQYAMAEKTNTNINIKDMEKFFHIKSMSAKKDILIDNLQYYTWNLEKVKVYRDIITLTAHYVRTFLEFKYNKELSDGKIEFIELINNLSDLKSLNDIEDKDFKKPFKNWYDTEKYLNNLKKINLIITDKKRRNASYELTKECKDCLYGLHVEHLKSILITKIKVSPYPLIEEKYEKFLGMFE